jgi:hypothetical protein
MRRQQELELNWSFLGCVACYGIIGLAVGRGVALLARVAIAYVVSK